MDRHRTQQGRRWLQGRSGPDLLTPVAGQRGQRIGSSQGIKIAPTKFGAQSQVFDTFKGLLGTRRQDSLNPGL